MIIENVSFPAGRHCETTTLGALLRQAGVEVSEQLLFGLGEGLGFVYWDAKNMDVPFLGGRVKPFELTRTAAGRLGSQLEVRETSSPRKAWQNVETALSHGRPVGLQLDSYHLAYFTAKVHFGGHFVAMYGYDDQHAHLVDTAQQGGAVTTSLASLELARGERGPMTARNLSYTITRTGQPDLGAEIRSAIASNARAFLTPPIANLGHRGIAKAAEQVLKWHDRSIDLTLVATLMERGGTGGSLFRAIYRDFLAEAATIVDDDTIREGHRLYAEIAPLWTEVAQHIEQGDLPQASKILTELAELERHAMEVLSVVSAGSPQ